IRRHIEEIFPGSFVESNVRLNDMRSMKGKPLELDIYIPDKQLAIEIQGPQHFEEIYGCNKALKSNDQHKKQLCREKGIKLLWMDWEGINRDLLKISYEQRHELIDKILHGIMTDDSSFIWWRDSTIIIQET